MEKKIIDNIEYNYEIPTKINVVWAGKEQFVQKLKITEEYLTKHKKFYIVNNDIKNCSLCNNSDNKNNISIGFFKLNKIIWDSNLRHYITKHNIIPSDIFIDYIYKFNIKNKQQRLKLDGVLYTKSNIRYIKLDRNQIMIMDALMKHGGYTKKYISSDKTKKIYRYSEHSGLIDFNNQGVDKIVIVGNTNRIDKGDSEIYLPKNIPEAYDYEYIFHTHPPTPKPGGRAHIGILYEIPSVSDIFHFIDHYNNGTTQGSIVIASEGLYIIACSEIKTKKININENNFYKEINKTYQIIQKEGIEKYGIDFKTKYFYSVISQDIEFINKINSVLNKYKLHIYYYPRTRDVTNKKWIIDTVYLPVYIVEPI